VVGAGPQEVVAGGNTQAPALAPALVGAQAVAPQVGSVVEHAMPQQNPDVLVPNRPQMPDAQSSCEVQGPPFGCKWMHALLWQ